jgi:tetratricopeptide (TPR) repeat protein
VRWGAFESALGRPADALEHFDAAGTPDDPVVRFWLDLLKGQALERAHRLPEAVESYRRAVREAPFSQSANLALAAALADSHRMLEASVLINGAIRPGAGAGHIDPWAYYDAPDVRRWPELFDDLRQAVAR